MSSKYSLTILKLIIIIILFGFYYSYFFKDVINSYSKGLTNLASTEKELDTKDKSIEAPTVIICMRPAWKKSVLEKYNTTGVFFQMTNGSYEHLIGEKTMQEIVFEASFRLSKDFNIEISSSEKLYYPKIDLKIGSNKFHLNEEEYTITVTDIYSLLYNQFRLANCINNDVFTICKACR